MFWRSIPVVLLLLAAPVAAAEKLLSPADHALYGRAFALAAAGEDEAALELARLGIDPLPAKILLWQALTRPEAAADFETVAAFLSENRDWPGRWALRRTAERFLPLDLPPREAIAWFEANPPATGLGVLRYARALLAAGERERAVELARRSWVEQDFTADEEAAFRRSFAAALTQEAEIARLERLVAQRNAGAARRQASRLGGGYVALTDARLRLATMSGGVDSAIGRIPRALAGHPGLAYERALWRLRKGRDAEAFELIHPPLEEANDARWWGLRHWGARWSLRQGDNEAAYLLAGAHGQNSGLAFAEGEFLAGWIALRRLRDTASAERHFERLYRGVSTPISLARGAYWMAEAARARGQEAEALTWYWEAARQDHTFYGLLARHNLDGGRPPATVRQPPSPPAQRIAFGARELARAARLLLEIEAPDDLVQQFFAALRLQAEEHGEWQLLAEFAAEVGRPDQALKTAKEAARRGLLLPQHLFPQPFELGGGEQTALLLAVIRQESEFDPKAVSPAGARGLMQLMPRTAKTVARRLGVRFDPALLTADPQYNITLGESYFGELLQRYDGYAPLAIAAYNAGPSRADEWIRTFGDPRSELVDPVDWIEQVPFEETRNYLQRVLEAAAVYGAPPDRASAILAQLLRLGPPQQALNAEP